MKKITYFYVYVYLWIIKKKKKMYKELKFSKHEFHITRNSSLVSSSTIEERKKRALRLSLVFTNNSSLISSRIVLHGTRVYQAHVPCGISSIKKSMSAQVFFFFLNETRVFKTRFTQQTRISKKWYIATYFVNSGMLLIIFAKSGKWPIWPIELYKPKTTCSFFFHVSAQYFKTKYNSIILIY